MKACWRWRQRKLYMMKYRNSKVSNPISPPQIQRRLPRLLLKPKAKKVSKDTKKKAKDGDKPKTESMTEPKKKLRKQAEPKKNPINEGNKDLEEAASATF